jgi:hypothetical protein
MVNVVVGTAWQTALVMLPIFVVLMSWPAALASAALAAVTSWILKVNWYDKLETTPAGEAGREAAGGPAVPNVR